MMDLNNSMLDSMKDDCSTKRTGLPEVPEGYHLRPLMSTDYYHGYLELLSQLTIVGDVTDEMFFRRFNLMRNTSPPSYYIIVIEHKEVRRIVASATLVLEWKFIHDSGCRGRIEDVVVDKSIRGQHFGMLLIQHLVELARHIGVYKLSLECKDELISFYKQSKVSTHEMSRVPFLASLDYNLSKRDKDWISHQLPKGLMFLLIAVIYQFKYSTFKESIEIPREHLPDPETENLPSSVSFRQESTAELEKRWTDTGIDRIFLNRPKPSRI
ncbi:Glucosamine 6-phosphate N-acetyltransferase [Dirofilaria immitis]